MQHYTHRQPRPPRPPRVERPRGTPRIQKDLSEEEVRSILEKEERREEGLLDGMAREREEEEKRQRLLSEAALDCYLEDKEWHDSLAREGQIAAAEEQAATDSEDLLVKRARAALDEERLWNEEAMREKKRRELLHDQVQGLWPL